MVERRGKVRSHHIPTVNAKNVGEILDKGKELYTVSDLKKIWVIADVNPNDIAAVGAGQPAQVTDHRE